MKLKTVALGLVVSFLCMVGPAEARYVPYMSGPMYALPTVEPEEVHTHVVPTPAPEVSTEQPAATDDAVQAPGIWDQLAKCETPPNGEWDYGPHSDWGSKLFHGGLQFHPDTWTAYRRPTDPDFAYQASRSQQIAVAERVLAEQGWEAWPTCSRKLGLR